MNDFDLCTSSPSLNLTINHHDPPIFTSTPLITGEKGSTTPQSSIFFPLTENTQHSDILIKLNEDLCLLGLFDYIPSNINLDQTLSLCRQLVKNYNKISQEKQNLYEKLKRFQFDQVQNEKRQDTIKSDLERLQTNRERLTDNILDYQSKIQQLTQTNLSKDKEIRRLNQLFAHQTTLAKHQYRNLEKQIDKLKERVLTCENHRMTIANIDYSWSLPVNESIRLSENSSEVLLKKICHDYDQKHRLLMIENEQIRQCLVDVHQKLNHLLLIHRTPSETLAAAGHLDDNFEAELMELPSEAVREIVQRRFLQIYEELDRQMWKFEKS